MNTVEYISEKVKKLVKKHGSRDPFELCEALGIRVRYMQLKTIKGFFFYQSRIRTVVLNAELSETVAKILCAHELGHACLHSDMLLNMRTISYEPFNSKNTAEYEANIFASELLIPDDSIKELLESEGKSFYSLAMELCVPPELIDIKLRVMQAKGYKIDVPYLAQSDFLKRDIDGLKAE
jgi:Zn-dependent peptidase ImmA (M78 family)